jgi:hypothetical protein
MWNEMRGVGEFKENNKPYRGWIIVLTFLGLGVPGCKVAKDHDTLPRPIATNLLGVNLVREPFPEMLYRVLSM